MQYRARESGHRALGEVAAVTPTTSNQERNMFICPNEMLPLQIDLAMRRRYRLVIPGNPSVREPAVSDAAARDYPRRLRAPFNLVIWTRP